MKKKKKNRTAHEKKVYFFTDRNNKQLLDEVEHDIMNYQNYRKRRQIPQSYF